MPVPRSPVGSRPWDRRLGRDGRCSRVSSKRGSISSCSMPAAIASIVPVDGSRSPTSRSRRRSRRSAAPSSYGEPQSGGHAQRPWRRGLCRLLLSRPACPSQQPECSSKLTPCPLAGSPGVPGGHDPFPAFDARTCPPSYRPGHRDHRFDGAWQDVGGSTLRVSPACPPSRPGQVVPLCRRAPGLGRTDRAHRRRGRGLVSVGATAGDRSRAA